MWPDSWEQETANSEPTVNCLATLMLRGVHVVGRVTSPYRLIPTELSKLSKFPRDSCGEGDGSPLQYSCLKSPMDRGAWQATVGRVARAGHDLAAAPAPVPPALGMWRSRDWLHVGGVYWDGCAGEQSDSVYWAVGVSFKILCLKFCYLSVP